MSTGNCIESKYSGSFRAGIITEIYRPCALPAITATTQRLEVVGVVRPTVDERNDVILGDVVLAAAPEAAVPIFLQDGEPLFLSVRSRRAQFAEAQKLRQEEINKQEELLEIAKKEGANQEKIAQIKKKIFDLYVQQNKL